MFYSSRNTRGGHIDIWGSRHEILACVGLSGMDGGRSYCKWCTSRTFHGPRERDVEEIDACKRPRHNQDTCI